jgi:hypothetical protein
MEIENEELVSRLSFEVVKEVAPDELDLFDDIKAEFLKDPNAFAEKDAKKREKMLGFAVGGTAEQFVTGFILPVALDAVKKYLSKKLGKSLDKNEIKKLRDDAYNNAIALGMDEEKATLMADSLAGKLVLGL